MLFTKALNFVLPVPSTGNTFFAFEFVSLALIGAAFIGECGVFLFACIADKFLIVDELASPRVVDDCGEFGATFKNVSVYLFAYRNAMTRVLHQNLK